MGVTKNSNIQWKFLFEEKPKIMKNTHFAPVLHGLMGRGGRHSEKICIFFAKMKKQITPNVITFCSDFPYKKVYKAMKL